MRRLHLSVLLVPIIVLNYELALCQVQDPINYGIAEVSANGSGCKNSSVHVVLSPDAATFTLLYDQFAIDLRQADQQVDAMCTITIRINKPIQMGYSVGPAELRGFVTLDSQMIASESVSMMLATGPDKRDNAEFNETKWNGPTQENFTVTTEPRNPQTGKTFCHKMREEKFVIRSNLRIKRSGSPGEGQLAMDSIDGKLSQKFHLNWSSCENKK